MAGEWPGDDGRNVKGCAPSSEQFSLISNCSRKLAHQRARTYRQCHCEQCLDKHSPTWRGVYHTAFKCAIPIDTHTFIFLDMCTIHLYTQSDPHMETHKPIRTHRHAQKHIIIRWDATMGHNVIHSRLSGLDSRTKVSPGSGFGTQVQEFLPPVTSDNGSGVWEPRRNTENGPDLCLC